MGNKLPTSNGVSYREIVLGYLAAMLSRWRTNRSCVDYAAPGRLVCDCHFAACYGAPEPPAFHSYGPVLVGATDEVAGQHVDCWRKSQICLVTRFGRRQGFEPPEFRYGLVRVCEGLDARTKEGQVIRYLQLAHNEWDADASASRTKVLYSFDREDTLDTEAIRRLIAALTRLLDPAQALAGGGPAGLTFTESRPLGGTFVLDGL